MPDLTSPTYTQYSGPDFTVGTLSNIAACIDYIETHLQRGTLASQTVPTLQMAYEEIARAKEELLSVGTFSFKRKYVYTTTEASAYRYALPADFDGGEFRLRDVTNNFSPKYYPRHLYDNKFPDMSEESNGAIEAYTIKDRELWTYPPSSGSATLELEYGRSGDDTSAKDVSYLPELYRFAMCDGAIGRLFRSLKQYDVAKMYENDFQRILTHLKKRDNAKKWAKGGQAMTWQQEYSSRYYQ